MALWLVRSSPDQAVQVQAQAGIIMFLGKNLLSQ